MTKTTDYATLYTAAYLIMFGMLLSVQDSLPELPFYIALMLSKVAYIGAMLHLLNHKLSGMQAIFTDYCFQNLKLRSDINRIHDKELRALLTDMAEDWCKYKQPAIRRHISLSCVLPMLSVLMLDLLIKY